MSVQDGTMTTQKPSSSKAGVATIPLQHKTDGSKYSLEECYGKVVEIVNKAAGNVGIDDAVKYYKKFQVYEKNTYDVPTCTDTEIEYELAVLIVQALSNYFGYVVSKGPNIENGDKYENVLTSLSNLIEEYACKQTVRKPVHANDAQTAKQVQAERLRQAQAEERLRQEQADRQANEQAARQRTANEQAAMQRTANEQVARQRLAQDAKQAAQAHAARLAKEHAAKQAAIITITQKAECHNWNVKYCVKKDNGNFIFDVNKKWETNDQSCIDGILVWYAMYDKLIRSPLMSMFLKLPYNENNSAYKDAFQYIELLLLIDISQCNNSNDICNLFVQNKWPNGENKMLIWDFLQIFIENRLYCIGSECTTTLLQKDMTIIRTIYNTFNNNERVYLLYNNIITLNDVLLVENAIKELVPITLQTYLRFRHTNFKDKSKYVFQSKKGPTYIGTTMGYYLKIMFDEKSYISGPFTKIFFKEKNNVEVAKECNNITDQLNKNKSVFIAGYGASGAGKTSSLIYYRNETTPGILMYVIMNMKPKPTNIILQVHEYYNNGEYNQNDNVNKIRSTGDLSFSLKDNEYKLTNSYEYQKIYGILENELEVISLGTPLQECIIKLMDETNTRRIAATTNNPQSSRSHVLVSIKLGLTDTSPYLFVADFAGVENTFNCTSIEELAEIANIETNRDKSIKIFYNDENITIDNRVCNQSTQSTEPPLKFGGKITKIHLLDSDDLVNFIALTNDQKIVNEEIEKLKKTNKTLSAYENAIKAYNEQSTKYYENNKKLKNNAMNTEKNNAELTQAKAQLQNTIDTLLSLDRLSIGYRPISPPSSIIVNGEARASRLDDYNQFYNNITDKKPSKKVAIIKEKWTSNKGSLNTWWDNFYDSNISETITGTYKVNNHVFNVTLSDPAVLPTGTLTNTYGTEVKYDTYFNDQWHNGKGIVQLNLVYRKIEINDNNSIPTQTTPFDPDFETRYRVSSRIVRYFEYVIDRLNRIQNVCECRTREGKNINREIMAMRNTIFELIRTQQSTKSKSRGIYNFPYVYSKCASQNLPPFLLAFDKSSTSTNQTPKSDLLSSHVLNKVDVNELQIVIFNVFDNSNDNLINKTLYIDINDLKAVYHRYRISERYFKDPNVNIISKDTLGNEIYEELKQYQETEINQSYSIVRTQILKQLKSNKTPIAKTIYDKLDENVQPPTIQEFLNMLRMIQNINNTSPLGTLEFMDHMARMDIDDVESRYCDAVDNYGWEDLKYKPALNGL